MPVDPNMQYNGHNSFEVDVIQRSFPFGVEGHSHLTVHFSAWATSNLAEALRGETLFFNADGMRIERRTHTWSVPMTGFEKVVITQAIPPGAVQAQFEFLPNGTYWIVEPKGEFGEHASPFSINFSNQLSQIGPTGAYLGQIHSHQIVMTQGGGLDQYLSTWNARVLSFENRLTGATTNIDADGLYTGKVKADQIEGGVIRATSPVTYGPFTEADVTKVHQYLIGTGNLTNSEKLKYDVNSDGRITVTDMVVMNAMIDGRQDPIRTVKPVIRVEPQSLDFEGGIFFGNADDIDSETSGFYMSQGTFKGQGLEVGDARVSNNLEAFFIRNRNGGDAYIHFNDSSDQIDIRTKDYRSYDGNSRTRFKYDSSLTEITSPNGNNSMGVDNGGAYKIISGVKSYL